MNSDTGRIDAPSGNFVITWDHTDNVGWLAYRVVIFDAQGEYIARHDADACASGWVFAVAGHDTVDQRVCLPNDSDYDELRHYLDVADGRAVAGVMRK